MAKRTAQSAAPSLGEEPMKARKEPATPAAHGLDLDEEETPALELPRRPFFERLAGLHAVANPERLAFLVVIAVAAGITLPYLGSVGFFDPWETHYAEVARQMAVRNDYLYPFWKDAYFFSKPVLLFWLTSVGYRLIGAHNAPDAIPWGAELVGRLPSALFALMTVAAVYLAARRLWSRRAAVLSGLVLATVPFWGFMSRQAITDMLYVGPMSTAILLLAVAFFDEKTRDRLKEARLPVWLVVIFGIGLIPQLWEIGRTGHFLNRASFAGSEVASRIVASALLSAAGAGCLFFLWKKAKDPLVHAAAFLVALATLGKGPHALLFVGMIYFLYFLASGDWRLLRRASILSGIALYLLVALPWYVVMALFSGRDESHKTWVGRFIMHDLLGRIGAGVHGERGTFDYYLRYLSFGMFPWSAFLPVALLRAATERLGKRKERTPSQRFTLLVVLWAVSLFVFFTATTTKFHHYIFPVVVPAALLIGWWLDRLLESKERVAVGIAAFLVLAVVLIGRDLGAEPWQLVDLFTYHYKSWKPDYYFPDDVNWHGVMAAFGLLAAFVLFVGVASDAAAERLARHRHDGFLGAAARLLAPFAQTGRALATGVYPTRNGGLVLGAFGAALLFSVFAVHVYLSSMSQHWSQRWIFETYYAMRNPGERIIAYQMDWKGETFYGKNEEIQIKQSATDLKRQVEKPGRDFILVQTDRYGRVKSALGKEYEGKIKVVDRSNKKWFLVLVEE